MKLLYRGNLISDLTQVHAGTAAPARKPRNLRIPSNCNSAEHRALVQFDLGLRDPRLKQVECKVLSGARHSPVLPPLYSQCQVGRCVYHRRQFAPTPNFSCIPSW
jgi:hypothetical protein